MNTKLMAAIIGFIFVIHGSVFAQEWSPQQEQTREQKLEYSPYVGKYFPQRVYFGDTHHHSSYSFNSGMFGIEMDEVVRMTFQDRTCTSPTWCTP